MSFFISLNENLTYQAVITAFQRCLRIRFSSAFFYTTI